MCKVINPAGHLIAKRDPKTGIVEIKDKCWITRIELHPNGSFKITHRKES